MNELDYNNFLKKLIDCEGCPMRNYGKPVFSGNHLQEMMIIGYEPESHNVHIDSKLIAKTSSLLSLYEKEIKYGAYITYVYRCSLHIHGDLSDEARERCKEYMKEEFNIVKPKFVLIYDKRVVNEICDSPEDVMNAKEFPIKTTIYGNEVNLYYIE